MEQEPELQTNAPKLSRYEEDRYTAYIGMYADNNVSIWGQYERLVDFIFEQYAQTKLRFDPIAAPLLHTMAHGIELGLKENISFFREYHGINHLQKFESWTAMVKSHELADLAEEFRIGYFRLHDKFNLGQEEREMFFQHFEKLKALLAILDRSAETFRYATKIDKDGEFIKMSVGPQKTFDLLVIKALYDQVKTLLLGAPNSLARYTDFIDFQLGNPHYDAGKGYLYCQRLDYSPHFLELAEEKLAETLTKLPNGIWFDPVACENYEIQVWRNDIYIIAVDIARVMRRPKTQK